MTDADFRTLVSKMRAKQREYFNPKTRTSTSARDAMELERQVDKALAAFNAPPGLFDREDVPR